MTLEHALSNRDNNLTPVRLLLAWLVLFGHSYHIIGGVQMPDPLSATLKGTWIGAIAVHLFFAISGMLVAKSFADRGAVKYVISRILRIYPALIVCILLSVFLLGPLITKMSMSEYFSDQQTWDYLTNMTLYHKIEWLLPGVEIGGKITAMNGSLWTLPVEVRCYLILMILGLFGLFSSRLVTLLIAGALVWIGFTEHNLIPFLGHNEKWLQPASYFVIGVLAYQWAEMIPLKWPLVIGSALLLVGLNGTDHFHTLGSVPLVYICLGIAYLTPPIDMDNWLGDISYGTYIYAWPLQISTIIWFNLTTPLSSILIATPLTFFVAYLSWRFIERPALNLKNPTMKLVDKLLHLLRSSFNQIQSGSASKHTTR